jgi:hypothetical protein
MKTKLFSNFQRRKLQRWLDVHGQPYEFTRHPLNAYKEPVKSAPPKKIELVGLFYTQNNQKGFWMLNEFDETRVRYKRYLTSFIMVMYDDFKLDPILPDDQVVVNGKLFRVTGTTNVQEDNFMVNISLDLVV